MNDITIIEGAVVPAADVRIGVIVGRFNSFIVEQLERGCLEALRRHGLPASAITVARVPGAYEMPVVALRMAKSGHYDGIIALGAVIRGATPHFEQVAGACSSGLSGVAIATGVPVIFGVLTVDSIEQAIERAGTKAGNKGAEAAVTAIEMVSLLRQI
ncbi:MAG: 6,7-dimethyl-8-ribityllumazine synthase [Gammaproteobacteria bacterium]|nr:6,7-dimethyl-8-ribityllumazine synthase [Gammaproteobacteria bacterium]